MGGGFHHTDVSPEGQQKDFTIWMCHPVLLYTSTGPTVLFSTDLVDDPLHLECLEDVGAVADAVLHDEDEDGDQRQDHHVHRVQPLTNPGRKESTNWPLNFFLHIFGGDHQ